MQVREVVQPWVIRADDGRVIELQTGCRVSVVESDIDNLEMRLLFFGWYSMESVLWYTDPLSSSTSTGF